LRIQNVPPRRTQNAEFLPAAPAEVNEFQTALPEMDFGLPKFPAALSCQMYGVL
jgi:hypothetical protein